MTRRDDTTIPNSKLNELNKLSEEVFGKKYLEVSRNTSAHEPEENFNASYLQVRFSIEIENLIKEFTSLVLIIDIKIPHACKCHVKG